MRKLLRPKQIGISSSTVWELQQLGLYPKFFKIYGSKAAGIFEDEHNKIMTARAAGASNEQISELVTQIHQERQQAAEKVLEGTAA